MIRTTGCGRNYKPFHFSRLTNSPLKNLIQFCLIHQLRMFALDTFELHGYFFASCYVCAEVNVCSR